MKFKYRSKCNNYFRSVCWILLSLPTFLYNATAQAPCANCNGTWTDNYGYTWVLNTMSGGSVTGTFYNNGADTCPSYSSTVTGTYNATGSPQFTLYAQNPSVPAGTPCGNGTVITSSIGYAGNIQAGGCNSGGGSWSNSYPLTCSFTWSKGCDSPTGETTYDSQYWGDSGLQPGQTNPTEHLWFAQVTANADFSGRTVGEQAGAAGNDGCYNAAPDAGILPLTSVTGGTWYINTPALGYNQWAYDGVGYSPDAVNAYRGRGVEPCGTTFYQVMVIYCNDLSTINYQNNTLTATINDAATVSSGRGGLVATRVWP